MLSGALFALTRHYTLGIGGKAGQPVFAAAPVKVVYSGSGRRGYGKLFVDHVLQADQGCDFDFLRGTDA